jgi:hypothetical protein
VRKEGEEGRKVRKEGRKEGEERKEDTDSRIYGRKDISKGRI